MYIISRNEIRKNDLILQIVLITFKYYLDIHIIKKYIDCIKKTSSHFKKEKKNVIMTLKINTLSNFYFCYNYSMNNRKQHHITKKKFLRSRCSACYFLTKVFFSYS